MKKLNNQSYQTSSVPVFQEKGRIMKREIQLKKTVKTIAGVCIFLSSALSILYGGMLFPPSLTDVDFMSFLVGSMIGIAIGLCMISSVTSLVKQGFIIILGITVSAYCFLFEMDLLIKLIASICIMGLAIVLAFWIAYKDSESTTVKICKKCSAVSVEHLEKFSSEHGYTTRYGCIGMCAGKSNQPERYVGLKNGKLIQAKSEKDFFEQLK